MPDENNGTQHDINYKWRMIGAISIVFFTASSVTITAVFSTALSAQTIAGLFGMEFTVVLLMTLLVLRPISTNSNNHGDPQWFSMDNPWISVIFSCVSGILTSLFLGKVIQ